MKKHNVLVMILQVVFCCFLLSFAATNSAIAQTKDTVKTEAVQPVDTTKKNISASQMFSQLAHDLADSQLAQRLSPPSSKINYRIEKDAPFFTVPGGESHVALFELPEYITDYILVVRSMVHGIGFTWRMFGPNVVFLDSTFKPVFFVGEKKFSISDQESFKSMHLKAEIIIDSERKNFKYLLIYSDEKNKRLGSYNTPESQGFALSLLKHPIEKSPFGRLQLELHLR